MEVDKQPIGSEGGITANHKLGKFRVDPLPAYMGQTRPTPGISGDNTKELLEHKKRSYFIQEDIFLATNYTSTTSNPTREYRAAKKATTEASILQLQNSCRSK
ncbi:hypothetical protein H105_05198 [Trichophyton soudanense CBS 452.61]|uniref:Uncharacterized protein n=1 Tax=Trichophyton soudanense CBS 452.61 TaxID=1215331 RepID=A0A022XRG8_TRISD|nr:hypothetical protein H105_05198 [Trichophyton soudanense CBS 452.61]